MDSLPKRKNPRLKEYDYSQNGAYFITFCVKDKQNILGKVVGRGILDTPHIELSDYGINVCKTIDFVNLNINNIFIENYVVMPNHVHLIVVINEISDGAYGNPRPTNATIPKLISSIKRMTNKLAGFNIWQTSYHDHIIRNEDDYLRIRQYIDNNPAKWAEDKYFCE